MVSYQVEGKEREERGLGLRRVVGEEDQVEEEERKEERVGVRESGGRGVREGERRVRWEGK